MGRITESAKKRLKVDVKDKKILVLLSSHSRMSISDLSKRIRLSRDTVTYRIKRLEKLGIIQQFIPEINFQKLGYLPYHVFFLINETNTALYSKFLELLCAHPHTRRVIEYSDRWDLEWVFLCRNLEEFDVILTQAVENFSAIIMDKSSVARIGVFYSRLLPFEFSKEIMARPVRHVRELVPDAKDIDILQVIKNNCRLSTYDIAKKVRMSPDAIGIRLKKLFASTIIEKYTLLLNLSLLNYSLYTFAMQMKKFGAKEEATFRTFVRDHPQIIKAVKTFGQYDLLVYIIADQSNDFHTTVKEIKMTFASTLKNYDTFVAYREHVFNAVPRVVYGE